MTPRRPDWWRRYLGAPYAMPGASLETGIDCWELYRLVMREDFGIEVTDFGPLYAGEDAMGQARRLIADNLAGWRKVEWEDGAGVLFLQFGIPSHIGIATATRGVLLHASQGKGVTTLDLGQRVNEGWKDRLVGCFVPLA